MKFFDKVCDKLGLLNNDEINESVPEVREIPEAKPPEVQVKPAFEAVRPQPEKPANYQGSKVVDFHAAAERRENAMSINNKSQINTIKPKSFDDAQFVANCLRDKVPVIINFENTDPADASRIIDFISGTTYALNGDIKKVSETVFICAPNNVHVSNTDDEKKNSGSMPWLNNN